MHLQPKSLIESISSGLAGKTTSCSLASVTSSNGLLAGLTFAPKLLTYKAGDDVDGIGRAVVEIVLVHSGERSDVPAVRLWGERNRRVGATAKVSSCGLTLRGGRAAGAATFWELSVRSVLFSTVVVSE